MKTLVELAIDIGNCEKLGQDYIPIYDRYLSPLRDKSINLLEIGVQLGISLRLWEEYFPKANIIGLDINPKCAKYEGGRKKVYIGSQTDQDLLEKIADENNPLTVIIDDGSHVWKHQIDTFLVAFQLLAPGGLYFIEDMHTSYTTHTWNVGNQTGIDFTKILIDEVMLHGKTFDGFAGVVNMPLSYTEKWIESITFYRSLVVIKKWNKSLN
jgi:hypothetical protein